MDEFRHLAYLAEVANGGKVSIPSHHDVLPHSIWVHTNDAELYPFMFSALFEVLGCQPSPKVADGIIAHENEHYEAAAALGSTVSYFGLRPFVKDPNKGIVGFVGFFEAEVTTSKLGFASVVGRPTEPSEGDFDLLRTIGFQDITLLGEEISGHNEAHPEARFLYPLSLT